MSKENEVSKEAEPESPPELPNSVWSDYVGQHVCLQLNRPYFAVTAPGIFARGQEGFLQLPLMIGTFGLQQDKVGNVRVTMLVKDPDENKQTPVHISLAPDMIDTVSVTPLESMIHSV